VSPAQLNAIHHNNAATVGRAKVAPFSLHNKIEELYRETVNDSFVRRVLDWLWIIR
jgi:hypothetical protein